MVIPGLKRHILLGLTVVVLLRTTTSLPVGGGASEGQDEVIDGSQGIPEKEGGGGGGVMDDTKDRLAYLKHKLAQQAIQQYYANDDASQNLVPNKRLSVSGFYGARGKKFAQPNGFYGSRGKRSIPRSEHMFYSNGKRIDPDTFFGMRGKRTEEKFPLPQPSMRISNEQYYSDLLRKSSGDYSDSLDNLLMDDVEPLSPVSEDGNTLYDDVTDKEDLLALVKYYLATRLSPSPYSLDPALTKVKRQPPSGFHAIRGR